MLKKSDFLEYGIIKYCKFRKKGVFQWHILRYIVSIDRRHLPM